MAEYIDRNDAIKTIRTYFENLPWNGLATTVADDCEKLLNDIPTGDVRENKSGEWIKANPVDCDEETVRVCDNCFGPSLIPFNFCPHCGADMRKKNESY